MRKKSLQKKKKKKKVDLPRTTLLLLHVFWHAATYSCRALSVDDLSISKSYSISCSDVCLRQDSRSFIIFSNLLSLSAGSCWMSDFNCSFSCAVTGDDILLFLRFMASCCTYLLFALRILKRVEFFSPPRAYAFKTEWIWSAPKGLLTERTNSWRLAPFWPHVCILRVWSFLQQCAFLWTIFLFSIFPFSWVSSEGLG